MTPIEPSRVKEILDKFISERLLEVPQKIDAKFIITRILEQALYAAQLMNATEAKADTWQVPPIAIWTNIREDNTAPIKSMARSIWGGDHEKVARAVGKAATEKLERLNFKAIADEVYVDMKLLAYSLMAGDEESILIQGLFDAYATGGWPCGWAGNFPDGNMILYWPYDAAPVIKE